GLLPSGSAIEELLRGGEKDARRHAGGGANARIVDKTDYNIEKVETSQLIYLPAWAVPYIYDGSQHNRRGGMGRAPLVTEPVSTAERAGLEARAYASAFKTPVEARSGFEGLVYYPFWRLQYGYRDKKYAAVVDAAEGDVVYMEYPISVRGRAQSAIAAAMLIVGATAVSGLVGVGYGAAAPTAVGGLVASLPGVWRIKYTVERRAVYRQDKPVELL
ncbi:MAG: hypothetical protein ABWJ97_08375, partial [Thermoproteus sp.]